MTEELKQIAEMISNLSGDAQAMFITYVVAQVTIKLLICLTVFFTVSKCISFIVNGIAGAERDTIFIKEIAVTANYITPLDNFERETILKYVRTGREHHSTK